MNNSKLKEELLRYEDKKTQVYLDTEGYPTCGIGHMDKSLVVGQFYSEQQINEWFDQDILIAVQRAKRILGPCFDTMPDIYQRLFVNLTFNMGMNFATFTHCIAAAQKSDWNECANQLQNSKWFGQTGRRGREMVAAMRQGFYSWQ